MGALLGTEAVGEQPLELAEARWTAEADNSHTAQTGGPREPVSIPQSRRSIRMDGLRVSGRVVLLGSFLPSLSTD